jgi:hypothetical protein
MHPHSHRHPKPEARNPKPETLPQVTHPVRTAITASLLLRKTAKKLRLPPRLRQPMECDRMMKNATFFEEKALEVQLAAQEEDPELALRSLDCQLQLWTGA